MARKPEPHTSRYRQSQRIVREKAALKKRKALLRKVALGGGAALSVVMFSGGIWAWHSGAAGRLAQSVSNMAYGATARSGFAVESLYLEGRSRTPLAEIEQALGVRKGDPILRLSLDELRGRLEGIGSIKWAAVERELPGTLYVRIVERQPVARWQRQGMVALVDDNGVIMTGVDSAPYQRLPLILGEEAAKNVGELLALLASEPALAKRFAAAIYVGDRRWNIRLANGIEVQLPEQHPEEAWKKLAALQQRQQVLDRDVSVIDLRLEGKMFITVTPSAPPAPENARET